MKALRIEVDFATGRRAGGVDPHKHRGHPSWQRVDLGLEVRAIRDREAPQYDGIEGVTVLHNRAEIDAALAELADDRYRIVDRALMLESVRQKGIDLSDLRNDDEDTMAATLYERGALGIRRNPPPAPVEAVVP